MKIEIGTERPANFNEYWPGQYEIFSHFEYVTGIPHVLFAVTTFKENGLSNVNFHSWSSFQGDGDGFFAILAGLYQHTHAFADILRSGEFCVNFLAARHYDALERTIRHNECDSDEFRTGGFTEEKAAAVNAPRIAEAFLTLECRKEKVLDLSGAGKTALVIGRVLHAAAEEKFAHGLDDKYGSDGFMFNIHAPIDLITGEGNRGGIGTIKLERIIE